MKIGSVPVSWPITRESIIIVCQPKMYPDFIVDKGAMHKLLKTVRGGRRVSSKSYQILLVSRGEGSSNYYFFFKLLPAILLLKSIHPILLLFLNNIKSSLSFLISILFAITMFKREPSALRAWPAHARLELLTICTISI